MRLLFSLWYCVFKFRESGTEKQAGLSRDRELLEFDRFFLIFSPLTKAKYLHRLANQPPLRLLILSTRSIYVLAEPQHRRKGLGARP